MAWNVFRFCAALRGLGFLMVLLVLGVVGVTYYAVVVTDYGPALFHGGFSDCLVALGVLILFHALLMMLLWSYFSVVCNDPGGVPPNWKPIVDEEGGETSAMYASEFCRLQSDPANQRIRYCRKCNQFKPPRSHHCSICGRCVLKMDHHCIWVVNCVGALNYKCFLLFLFYTFLETSLVTLSLLPNFLVFFTDQEIHINPGGLAVTFIAFVLDLAFALSILGFLIMHISLVAGNTTTIEAYEKKTSLKWCYDLGRRKNFEQVFGTDKLYWFILAYTMTIHVPPSRFIPIILLISYTMICCNDATRILRTPSSLLRCPRVPTKPSPSPAAIRMQSSSFSVSDQPHRSRGKGRGFDGRIERVGTAGRGGGGRGRGGSGADKMDALSRLLTRILRHMASEMNLDMRSDGYVKVQDLLKLNLKTFANIPLKAHSVDEIKEVVRKDNKQRFSLLVENGKLLIRANQGHTLKTVESDSLLQPILLADEIPVCVHGTYKKNVQSILDSGLKRMQRLHVHFSPGLPTDGEVISGMRKNVYVLIFLDVRKALEDGMKLYISDNRVILTEGFDGVVPVKYFDKILSWPDGQPIPFLKSV